MYREGTRGAPKILLLLQMSRITQSVTLSIFDCSILNKWIRHKFHSLETSSPIHMNKYKVNLCNIIYIFHIK